MMRIESSGAAGAMRQTGGAGDVRKQGAAAATRVARGDDVQLSSRGRMLAIAREALSETPAVRQAVVDRARAQLDAGTYRADGRSIAEAMIATVREGA